MTYDLVIRGGLVADGTGGPAFRADIAINGDKIAEIGVIEETGREEIDATGMLVTPGFVDLHTHLDAQIGWDPLLSPVSRQGVTTALMGNCGVTFAPCKKEDQEIIAAMMETVEDIPREAILTGLPWTWENYGEYLDAIEEMNPAINIGGLVGHCAIRYYVMGDRGVAEQPTPEEQAQIVKIAGDAVKAGAVGFSTNRFLGHYMPDGRHVPGTHAHHEEVQAIAAAVGEAGGLMQNVLNLGGDFEGEAALLKKEAEAAGGRVLFSLTAGAKDTSGSRVRALIEDLQGNGHDVNAISVPRGTGGVLGLQCGLPWREGAWKDLSALCLEDRLAAIDTPETYGRLVAEAEAGDDSHCADIYWLGDGEKPNYTAGPESSLATLAEKAGEHPAETFLRMAQETGGKTLFTYRFFNKNLKALENLLSSEYCLPGLGDAGAHVSQVTDGGWATFWLSHWVRDEGLYPIEEGVRRVTSAPARVMGLDDRGTLQPGMRADINVIDLDALHEKMPEIVHNFPQGAPHFSQAAVGYVATVCNGTVILRDDQLTGARGGEIIRTQEASTHVIS